MKKKTWIFVLVALSVVLISTGTALAFFNFSQEGTTDNTITSGTMEFHYDEINRMGAGISLEDALPVDSNAAEMTNSNYFAFNVTGKTANQPISYVVTAKKSSDSDNLDGIVDLYLTDNTDTALFGGLHRYNNYVQYRNKAATEKVIYTGTVPANSSNYNQQFRLRMWIDQGVDFSGREETKYFCSGTEVELDSNEYNSCDAANLTQSTEMVYDYNGKTFKITVNVYTDTSLTGYEPASEQVSPRSDATLSSLTIANCTFTQAFDPAVTNYTCTEEPTTNLSSSDFNYTTTNPNATAVVMWAGATLVDPETNESKEAYSVTVTAEDGVTTKNYFIEWIENHDDDARLLSLTLTNCTLDQNFASNVTNYTCTKASGVSSSLVNPTYTTFDSQATVTTARGGTLDPNTNQQYSGITITVTARDGVTQKNYSVNWAD